MTLERQAYLAGLDPIRFIAALLVVIYHLGYSSWALESVRGAIYQRDAYAFPELAPFAWFGFVGVEIFFVISGLVIAMSAQGSEAKKFLTGRIERLYPAAWICATITLFFALTVEQDNLAIQYLTTMALFPTGPWIDGQYWTLGVEIMFYLLVLTCIIRKLDLILLAKTITVVSVLYLFSAFAFPEMRFAMHGPFRILLLNSGVFFALGMFLYGHTFTGWRGPVWFTLAIVGCAIELLITGGERFPRAAAVSSMPDYMVVAPLIVWLIALAGIVGALRFRSRIAGSAVTRQLGLATYPLYLIHYAPGVTLVALVSGFLGLAVAIAAVVSASFAISLYAEPRLRSALRKIAR